MRVLTYVETKLTVIAGDKFFSEISDKPDFITGEAFYYEPTLKMMDGAPLDDEQKDRAEQFISAFTFPIINIVPEVKHYVDTDGNYIGNEAGIELPKDVEPEYGKYYDGVSFIEGVLVDAETGAYRGEGDTRTAEGTKYAPKATLPTMFGAPRYVYDFDKEEWTITLEQARACKIDKLNNAQQEATDALIGLKGYLEVTSFLKQETEARAWILDNNAPTPFIDNLMMSRLSEETKGELVSKIIRNADEFDTDYAKLLGRYQRGVKLVNKATTPEEVYNIKWEDL